MTTISNSHRSQGLLESNKAINEDILSPGGQSIFDAALIEQEVHRPRTFEEIFKDVDQIMDSGSETWLNDAINGDGYGLGGLFDVNGPLSNDNSANENTQNGNGPINGNDNLDDSEMQDSQVEENTTVDPQASQGTSPDDHKKEGEEEKEVDMHENDKELDSANNKDEEDLDGMHDTIRVAQPNKEDKDNEEENQPNKQSKNSENLPAAKKSATREDPNNLQEKPPFTNMRSGPLVLPSFRRMSSAELAIENNISKIRGEGHLGAGASAEKLDKDESLEKLVENQPPEASENESIECMRRRVQYATLENQRGRSEGSRGSSGVLQNHIAPQLERSHHLDADPSLIRIRQQIAFYENAINEAIRNGYPVNPALYQVLDELRQKERGRLQFHYMMTLDCNDPKRVAYEMKLQLHKSRRMQKDEERRTKLLHQQQQQQQDQYMRNIHPQFHAQPGNPRAFQDYQQNLDPRLMQGMMAPGQFPPHPYINRQGFPHNPLLGGLDPRRSSYPTTMMCSPNGIFDDREQKGYTLPPSPQNGARPRSLPNIENSLKRKSTTAATNPLATSNAKKPRGSGEASVSPKPNSKEKDGKRTSPSAATPPGSRPNPDRLPAKEIKIPLNCISRYLVEIASLSPDQLMMPGTSEIIQVYTVFTAIGAENIMLKQGKSIECRHCHKGFSPLDNLNGKACRIPHSGPIHRLDGGAPVAQCCGQQVTDPLNSFCYSGVHEMSDPDISMFGNGIGNPFEDINQFRGAMLGNQQKRRADRMNQKR